MRRRTILWAGKPLVIGSAGRTHWAALHGTFVLALLVIAEGEGAAEPPVLGKTYINLTVPEPWGKDSSTRVLEATAERTVVAQRGSVRGRRDIRVVEVVGGRSHSVGSNGNGITGIDGSFLHDAARSPDGRLWIVAEHSRFPNGILGNQFCLYVLEEDVWRPVGPRFGAPREEAWNSDYQGLHFFEDGHAVSASLSRYPSGDEFGYRLQLMRLEGDLWVPLPGHEYAFSNETRGQLVWRRDDAWLFQITEESRQTSLDVRRIHGADSGDVAGPFHVDSWPDEMCFFHIAVSPGNSIAVVGCKGPVEDIREDTPFFVNLYHTDDERGYELEEVSFPPGPGHALDIVAWSPNSDLHVVRSTKNRVQIFRLINGDWKLAAEATESRDFLSFIESPLLFFRDDETPIVTWEVFVQVD